MTETVNSLIESLSDLGISLEQQLKVQDSKLHTTIQNAYGANRWFTPENIEHSLYSITHAFLERENLNKWLSRYNLKERTQPARIGIIMAGNIPLVGFHDLLSVIVTGNIAAIKLSSKDNILLPFIIEELFNSNPELKNRIEVADKLNHVDAIIATGSNNSSRYFDYYFSRFPKIIRRNRGSVAVLTGKEKKGDLFHLGTDIFRYFGLGCRNVSKLFVPDGYSFDNLFSELAPFSDIIFHSKYKNNYDYNRTLLLMNKTPFLTNDFLIVKEDVAVSSPVATLHYEYYSSEKDLQNKLSVQQNNIQCIVGEKNISFGKTQEPQLWDYADDVDTVQFILSLEK